MAGADPCLARRERRREIHPGQGHLRPDPAERRRDALAGREDGAVRTIGSACTRHRHGVPAFFAVRQPHRRGERGARPRRQGEVQGHLGTARAGLQSVRASARSQAPGLAAFGRRAPAHRDRPRADAESEIPHPRRTDRRADAAGGRPALHRAQPAEGGRPGYPLHQPQARRGEAAVRHRHHSARRQEGRHLQSQGGDRRLAGAHDGRRRDQAGEGTGEPPDHGAAARRQRSQSRARRSARRPARKTFHSSSGVAKSSASPASPATVRTNCSQPFRANGWQRIPSRS